jgi:hypothetical protein
LADPPEIGISKISEDGNKKKSARRLFRQLPSDAKAVNKICKVWSLGHGTWLLCVGPDCANIPRYLEVGFLLFDRTYGTLLHSIIVAHARTVYICYKNAYTVYIMRMVPVFTCTRSVGIFINSPR